MKGTMDAGVENAFELILETVKALREEMRLLHLRLEEEKTTVRDLRARLKEQERGV